MHIKAGTEIDVIHSNYKCYRYNDLICIGCETHSLKKWQNKKFQAKMAKENDQEWWEEKGRRILNFLLDEE